MAPCPVKALKQPVKALHTDVDTPSLGGRDKLEQLATCHPMLAAYTSQNSGTLDWLEDSGADREITNDAQIFVATHAPETPVQAVCVDGYRVPAV